MRDDPVTWWVRLIAIALPVALFAFALWLGAWCVQHPVDEGVQMLNTQCELP